MGNVPTYKRKKILKRDLPLIEKVFNPKGKEWEIHHTKPKFMNGNDELGNLEALPKRLHKKIHLEHKEKENMKIKKTFDKYGEFAPDMLLKEDLKKTVKKFKKFFL